MSFEAIHGLYHYLICPEDDIFIANSLERLSYHEYLYRRLREQGYRRIVFFDYQKESHQYKIVTFDKLSQVSFERGKLFLDADIENPAELSKIYKQAEDAPELNTVKLKDTAKDARFTEKDLGMAVLGSKISGAKLHKYLMNNVCSALLQSRIKTAIVLPVAILDTIEGEQMGTFLETFNKLYTAQNFNHIILFTMPERGDMLKFRRYADMLRGFKGECCAQDAWLEKSIASLKASDNLVEVSQLAADEIENLLIREKFAGRLNGLEYAKIGGIARLILKQCQSKKCRVFDHLKSVSDPEKTRQYFPMRMIEHCLSDPLFCAEIYEIARNLKGGEIAENTRAPLCISRFDGGGGRYKTGESAGDIIAELDNFVGMEYLKEQVLIFANKFKKERKKYEDALKLGGKIPEFPYMNMRFVGPPGTGKTTVANIVGRLLCAEGILHRDEITCFKAGDIHSGGFCDVIGGEIEKRIDAGLGGVVVIDEFYNFNRAYNGGNQANEAFSAIMGRVDDHKEDLCLILAGYEDEMDEMFRSFNPGGARRFPYVFTFKPYSTDELFEIAEKMADRDGMRFSDDARDAVKKVIDRARVTQGKGFGNAGFIGDELLPKIDAAHLSRGGEGSTYTAEDVAAAFSDFNGILSEGRESEAEILAELDALVGMDGVKRQIKLFVKKLEKERKKYDMAVKSGWKVPKMPYMNIRFEGPPGTGKTTVAEILARLLCAKGILYRSEPTFFNAGEIQSGGIADVVGREVSKRIESGLGGVVVIDEFYNFDRAYSGGNIANEALSAIMSGADNNKENLCLIVAGYEDEMDRMFKRFNPGAARRFPYVFTFKSYSSDELMVIAEKMADRDGMRFSDEVKPVLKRIIQREKVKLGRSFGNAGFIEDYLLPKIDAEYLLRDGEDGIYTTNDVFRAFEVGQP